MKKKRMEKRLCWDYLASWSFRPSNSTEIYSVSEAFEITEPWLLLEAADFLPAGMVRVAGAAAYTLSVKKFLGRPLG